MKRARLDDFSPERMANALFAMQPFITANALAVQTGLSVGAAIAFLDAKRGAK